MPGDFSGAVDGFMGLLKGLKKEEILEVFSEVGTEGFCQHCQAVLLSRFRKLIDTKKSKELSEASDDNQRSVDFWSANSSSSVLAERTSKSASKTTSWSSIQTPEHVYSSPTSVNSKQAAFHHSDFEIALCNGRSGGPSHAHSGLSKEHEGVRFAQIGRKKDFVHIERVNGKTTNVLHGLELHTGVFNAEEQKEIVDCVYGLQRKGQNGQLRERTYSEPRKWMRGKGRVTIQFGCCYNYAVDKNGNPPGIVRDEDVDPLPSLFKQMIKRMVRWHVLPPTCVPNSCIVNIYEAGDCIPPHIDHHDFVRPFCTVSFLTECNILFGASLKVVDAGEFSGPVSIPLPVGKMDDAKQPYRFSSDPELTGTKPLVYSPNTKSLAQQQKLPEDNKMAYREPVRVPITAEASNKSIFEEKYDFPVLGSSSFVKNQRVNRYSRKQ
ncbi:hypothetical protein RHGRI_014127 [Rhododendron griersonianum]|uniref:Alpha-ketoglutarate-dependent dioxygenase AlkB-like domain-containing protein n=1 Tax=Rhododendron griersonianum TaxID=479676 RepID=A0AAV6K8I7_9ERIC|nr:hypothetical protein RHGRI_014127 [Rhododendron griersonianum]